MITRKDHLQSIRAAVEYIEDNLDGALSTEAVAAAAGFSQYHFHRLFAGILGESVAEYIRKRRLSEAAVKVRNTDLPLIDLAITYGFESQESFTRAFKKTFGITPGRYRALKSKLSLMEKVAATNEMLEHLTGGITMQPRIVEREGELAVGMGGAFAPGDHINIGQLWQRFNQRMGEIKSDKGYALGICSPSHGQIKSGTDEFVYVAAMPVDEGDTVPEGMVSCLLQGGKYAVFTHKGSLNELPHTINFIWGTWLTSGDHEHRDAPDFEIYDDRFDINSPDSEFDIYIPIK